MSTLDVTYTAPIANAPALSISAILGDLYTLRSAGAALNGSFNDLGTVFSGVDDTAAVQALFDAAGSFNNPPIGLSADWQGGYNSNNTPQREVSFPRGSVFLVKGTINVPPGVRVRGNSSVVLQTDTTSGVPTFNCLFESTAGPFEGYSGNSFHNLLVWGGAPGVSNNIGIRMGACQDFTLDDCIIGGFRVGVDLWSCQYADIDNSQIEYNIHNVIFRNYPVTAGDGKTGGPSPTIDFRMQNSRASASVGGYGLWLQNAVNVVIDQIDCNFCGAAMLVAGGALPDHISRIITVTNPGAGYTPGTWPLTITDAQGTGFQGFAVVGSNGQVTAAYATETGVASGAGVSQELPAITLSGAGNPTKAASFQAIPRRDATTYADLIDHGNTATPVTRSYGDITIRNFKAEVAASADHTTGIVTGAPDCGYVIYGDSNGSIRIQDVKLSSYGRFTDNYYRWGCFHGGAEIDVQEWDDGNAGLANPAVAVAAAVPANQTKGNGYVAAAGDYGLFRCTANARITLPIGVSIPNFYRYVIDANSAPATGGEQIYIEAISADARLMSGVALSSSAYFGNARLRVINNALRDVRSVPTPFTVDGEGNTVANSLACVPITINYTYYTNTMVADFSVGMHQQCTLNTSAAATGGHSSITLLNGFVGCWHTLAVAQDSTGGRTALFTNNNIRWQGGTAPVLSTAANAVDLFRIYFDGTSYFVQPLLGF